MKRLVAALAALMLVATGARELARNATAGSDTDGNILTNAGFRVDQENESNPARPTVLTVPILNEDVVGGGITAGDAGAGNVRVVDRFISSGGFLLGLTGTMSTHANRTLDTFSLANGTIADLVAGASAMTASTVFGAGIPPGTYVTAIDVGAGTVTLSNAATATASGVAVTFGGVGNNRGGTPTSYAALPVIQASRVEDAPPGLVYSLKATVQRATPSLRSNHQSLLNFYQYVTVADFPSGFGTANAHDLRVQAWVKASVAGDYALYVASINGYRTWGHKITISTPNTWQLFAFPITGDTSTQTYACTGGPPRTPIQTWPQRGPGFGLEVGLVLWAGTDFQSSSLDRWQCYLATAPTQVAFPTIAGATLQLAGPRVEFGDTAPTPARPGPLALDLARAQQVYAKTYARGAVPGTPHSYNGMALYDGTATAGQPVGSSARWNQALMCGNPTVKLFSPQTGAVGKAADFVAGTDVAANVLQAGPRSLTWSATPVRGGAARIGVQATADCGG